VSIQRSVEQFPELIRDPENLLCRFLRREASDIEPSLKIISIHPLAVDDALDATHVPKLDDWEEYLYLVLSSITYEKDSHTLEILELDIFLGKNFLVTLHDSHIQPRQNLGYTPRERNYKLMPTIAL
jgi:magnesium transporter